MNDGMSQDPWEEVIEASELLRATGAELFGVALGEKIDLRELKRYIGNTKRIYGDNSIERFTHIFSFVLHLILNLLYDEVCFRFLTDVISLLFDEQDCRTPTTVSLQTTSTSASDFNDQICNTPNLDIIILFDNAIKGTSLNEQSISLNRYLLLDVLGKSVSHKFFFFLQNLRISNNVSDEFFTSLFVRPSDNILNVMISSYRFSTNNKIYWSSDNHCDNVQ